MYPPLPKSDVQLADGRTLSYAEYGRPNGAPVFLFHGTPGSRLMGRMGHNAAADRNIRLIAPDRPGFGRSSFQRKRKILDWTDDVLQLADSLAIERFAVLGVSGGGPYAAACAMKIPERLTATGIVSGIAPVRKATIRGMSRLNRGQLILGRRLPPLLRAEWAMLNLFFQRYPERMAKRVALAAPDQEILERDEVRNSMIADMHEAMATGSHGVAYEMSLFSRPWGFRLEDITMPVKLWQGEDDRNVPVAMGRYQAKAITNCTATFIPGAGHLWFADNFGAIFASLIHD
jgi:pimeloyl-ACP methyl ester carboxylesterase